MCTFALSQGRFKEIRSAAENECKQNVAANHTNKSETFKTPREYIRN